MKNNIRLLLEAGAGGGGGNAASGMQKFSASAVSPKIDEIIKYKNEIYDALKNLTKEIDEKVNNDGDAILGGAVGDLKEDWAAFQKDYNDFSTSMDNVRTALKTAGDSYDTFNRSIAAAEASSAVTKPSAGAPANATSGIYATTK